MEDVFVLFIILGTSYVFSMTVVSYVWIKSMLRGRLSYNISLPKTPILRFICVLGLWISATLAGSVLFPFYMLYETLRFCVIVGRRCLEEMRFEEDPESGGYIDRATAARNYSPYGIENLPPIPQNSRHSAINPRAPTQPAPQSQEHDEIDFPEPLPPAYFP
ncbi:hypothetical protein F4804DRAFT_300242 [Jackrogersella minutella]|nr:hypothetical protein F4804DRAFT_300242 [Jackrogersella minutella]